MPVYFFAKIHVTEDVYIYIYNSNSNCRSHFRNWASPYKVPWAILYVRLKIWVE